MSIVNNSSGYPLWITKCRRWGGSFVIVVPTAVRERLMILDGGLIAMRVHEPFATMRAFPPPAIPSPEKLDPAKLPPEAAEVRRRA